VLLESTQKGITPFMCECDETIWDSGLLFSHMYTYYSSSRCTRSFSPADPQHPSSGFIIRCLPRKWIINYPVASGLHS